MKTRPSRRQTAKVSPSRWLAYASASAATVLAGSHSAEAAIHYSGRLDVSFPPHRDKIHTFPLDQAGDSLVFAHTHPFSEGSGNAYLYVNGISHARLQGRTDSSIFRVYKLSRGANVSGGFVSFYTHFYGLLAGFKFGYWMDHGTGYIGFAFNNGAGAQLGWVRVKMTGQPENGFRVLDYAYADPGEPIRAGQKSSDEQVPDQGSTDEDTPDQGSLGGLALGAVGLLAWRKNRSRRARLEVT